MAEVVLKAARRGSACFQSGGKFQMRVTKPMLTAILATAALLASSACSGQPLSTRVKGTLGGGALGAGTGAIIGAAVGAPGAGAAIGGALGAGTGFLVGNELQNHEVRQSHLQSQMSMQQREIENQRRDIQALKQQQEMERSLAGPSSAPMCGEGPRKRPALFHSESIKIEDYRAGLRADVPGAPYSSSSADCVGKDGASGLK